MSSENYGRLLDTIQITLAVAQAETTEFIPELGCITQSIWNSREQAAIKKQLLGLMQQVPDPSFFSANKE